MRIRYWSSDVCSSDLTGNVQEKLNNLNGRTPDFWSDVLSNPDWFGGVGGPAVIRLGEGAGANIPEDSITAKDIIAFGPGALNNAEDGNNLVAIGGNTMSQGRPGSHNVAIGKSALPSELGRAALRERVCTEV